MYPRRMYKLARGAINIHSSYLARFLRLSSSKPCKFPSCPSDVYSNPMGNVSWSLQALIQRRDI